jgi:DUF1365 family protein
MHHRLGPKQHRFHYDIFLFYLDLDEIDGLAKRLKCMGRNRRNLFNFRDKDHMQFPGADPKPIRGQLTDYLLTQGVHLGQGRVQLLTNLCTLGYQFNPVSLYFCFDENDRPLCSVVEVGNTFREMKLYFLGADRRIGNVFRSSIPKYFYVSPFIDMDTSFDFDLAIPDEKLRIKIDDYDKDGNRFFISTLTGTRKLLTDANLLIYFFSFPLITLKVIGLIHWQALRLWIKRLPYHKKAAQKDLQREVLRPYKSI